MCTLQAEETHLAAMAYANTNRDEVTLSLFDISWEDVLIPHVAVHLTLKDLFNLRSSSRTALRFVESALEKRQELHLSGNSTKNIELAFKVMARCCRRVESLQLACCKWLTDELLLPLLAYNKQLRVVNLNECVNITPLALQPIIIECKELRVLKLSKCQWLTTGAVDALTLHQSKLVEFDISHCGAIGERCLIIFFRKLNRLQVLSLAQTPSVTDQVLIQIGNFCRELQHINLIGCGAISDYGIHSLTRTLPRLQSLMVQRCPLVTERVLGPLRGRLHIDKPSMGYNLHNIEHCLYLQV
ncbi:F-box/LRR-repeat protein 15 isoform X2 [Scaptodrosophila lebanonensis]|uniref:F-box/LRR-repeat protein 15 isoform X2 n=1 Tax=Drosophila lebanonensis TaxID=7225 RepID=A0A6J2U4K6_DROLE|nr:F-box/LRR-repeat protein 15 isoform X2 [Scaptodrosophila lebanonensis]